MYKEFDTTTTFNEHETPAESHDVIVAHESADTVTVQEAIISDAEIIDAKHIPTIYSTEPLPSEEFTPLMNQPIPEKVVRKSISLEENIRSTYSYAAETISTVRQKSGEAYTYFDHKAEADNDTEAARHTESLRSIELQIAAARRDIELQEARMREEERLLHEARNRNIRSEIDANNKTDKENNRAWGNMQSIIVTEEKGLDSLSRERDEAIDNDELLCAEYETTKSMLSDALAEESRISNELAKAREKRVELMTNESKLYTALRHEVNRLETDREKELRQLLNAPEFGSIDPATDKLISDELELVTSTKRSEIEGKIARNDEDKRSNLEDIDSYKQQETKIKTEINQLQRRVNELPALIKEEKARFVKICEEIETNVLRTSGRIQVGAEQYKIINEGKATEEGTIKVGNEQIPIHGLLVNLNDAVKAHQRALSRVVYDRDSTSSEDITPKVDVERLRETLTRNQTHTVELPNLSRILDGEHASTKERYGDRKSFKEMGRSALVWLGLAKDNRPKIMFDVDTQGSGNLAITGGVEE